MKVWEKKEVREFLWGQIIRLHQCGKSNRGIARFFQINQTVNNIVKKFNEGHCHVEQCSGRPSIVSEQMKRILKREVIRNCHQCSKDVANSMEMLPCAVRKTMKELGYQRVSRKKPLISEVNRNRHMDWAREFKSKD